MEQQHATQKCSHTRTLPLPYSNAHAQSDIILCSPHIPIVTARHWRPPQIAVASVSTETHTANKQAPDTLRFRLSHPAIYTLHKCFTDLTHSLGLPSCRGSHGSCKHSTCNIVPLILPQTQLPGLPTVGPLSMPPCHLQVKMLASSIPCDLECRPLQLTDTPRSLYSRRSVCWPSVSSD